MSGMHRALCGPITTHNGDWSGAVLTGVPCSGFNNDLQVFRFSPISSTLAALGVVP